MDTCKGEAVRSSKIAEGQKSVNSRVSAHLVIEFCINSALARAVQTSARSRAP